MRYIGQSYDVATPVPSGPLSAESIAHIKAEFNRAHEREYGVYSETFGIAFVTLRVTGVGATTKPTPQAFQRSFPVIVYPMRQQKRVPSLQDAAQAQRRATLSPSLPERRRHEVTA